MRMTTQHLDEERIQRIVDGELAAVDERPTREHLASCTACREKVAAVQREQVETQNLFAILDEPATAAAGMPAPIARPFVLHDPAAVPFDVVFPARPARRVLLRRAAIVVLAFGLAGAAYAAPGSPLPELVRRIAARLSGSPGATPQPRREVPPPVQEPIPAVSGIGIPATSSIRIVFTRSQV